MSTDEVLAGYDGKPGLAYGLASDHRFGGELRQDVEDDIIRDASNGTVRMAFRGPGTSS